MITEIKLNNVATYKKQTIIPDLNKVNFFFGNNGTGKSSIGKYLYELSLNEKDINSSFNLCSQTGYDLNIHEILVFNNQFVEKNFIQKNVQKGIFSLNETNQKIDNLISEEQRKVNLNEEYITSKIIFEKNRIIKNRESDYNSLKDYCFNERKSTISSFFKIKENFPNKQTQNNFNKIKSTLITLENTEEITLEDLSTNYKKLYDSNLQNIPVNISSKTYKKIRVLENELYNLLNEVIVGNKDVDIAKLIDDLEISSWVEEGITFLKKNEDLQVCPFCQKQTVDKNLILKFENYFDETYKTKLEKIEYLKNTYKSKTNDILVEIKNISQYLNPSNTVSTLYENLKSLFDDNINIIESKIKASNERKELKSLLSFKSSITAINKIIYTNNQEFKDIDANRNDFQENIWKYLAQKCGNKINHYFEQEKKYIEDFFFNIDIENYIKDLIKQSNLQIAEWKGKTVTTTDAINNINKILNYSGFDSFFLKEIQKENDISQYILQRTDNDSGNIFLTLSEGEKNFIAFLYFYQLCLGTDNQNNSSKKKIIVIDDPVSSLDNQVLFIITTLVRKLIEKKGKSPDHKDLKNTNISQVFILTHNIYFHKEVSFDNGRICYDKSYYYIFKENSVSIVEYQGNKNKILNDYSLLWSTLNKLKNSNDATLNIATSNIMRRILESYVNFIRLGTDSWGALTNIPVEDPKYIICSALVSEINDASHKISPLDEMYFQRIINTTPQNLFESFELIFKELSQSHYDAMINIG
ncbi:AAA family ATPase [Chryseobacterium sp. SIMBA_028]|uniref:AAA family ATPase n=5 Tax=Bacteria TaxID=2 RepID=UPI003979F337